MRLFLTAGALALLTANAYAAPPAIATFDPPGFVQSTRIGGINAAGTVAGTYIATIDVAHGFIRTSDGTFQTIDLPQAGTESDRGTFVTGINDAGTVVGYYGDQDRLNFGFHGFVRAADGSVTTFDFRKTDPKNNLQTLPNCINKSGAVAGGYGIETNSFSGWSYGSFGRLPGGARFLIGGNVVAMNNARSTVGNIMQHGFLRTANGLYIQFDPDGSHDTEPKSINTAGTIVGNYRDRLSTLHGFIRTVDGTITSFDVRGSLDTEPAAINDRGWITGSAEFAKQISHGFMRTPAGAISRFDVVSTAIATIPEAINAKGQVAGVYQDSNEKWHAFVRSAP
jgi:hypothetical protein